MNHEQDGHLFALESPLGMWNPFQKVQWHPVASIGGFSWNDPCLAYKVWSNYSGGLRCGSLRAKSIARHGRVDRRAHGHPVLKRRYCVAFSEAQPIGAIWVGLPAPTCFEKSPKKRIPETMPACFEKSQKEDSWCDASVFWKKAKKEDSWNDASVFWKKAPKRGFLKRCQRVLKKAKKRIPETMPACFEKKAPKRGFLMRCQRVLKKAPKRGFLKRCQRVLKKAKKRIPGAMPACFEKRLRAARQTARAAALPCSRRWSDLEKRFPGRRRPWSRWAACSTRMRRPKISWVSSSVSKQ